MRVSTGVAMTGKMFRARQHSIFLESPNFSCDEPTHGGRILAERTYIDDGIRRIVVDVGDGGECEMDSHRSAFECGDAAELVCIPVAAGSAYTHIWREGSSTVQPDRGSCFEIRRNQ